MYLRLVFLPAFQWTIPFACPKNSPISYQTKGLKGAQDRGGSVITIQIGMPWSKEGSTL